MTHRIALITDSTCDLPRKYLDKHDIQVVPLTIVWGGEQFLDGVDLQADEFYQRLAVDSTIPTTSQPTPQQMVLAYEKARNAGAEELLMITISSAMSGTYESALKASELVEFPVQVLDSRSNSMSLGWQVLAAARAREEGGNIQDMIRAADNARASMVYLITLDTLEYLQAAAREPAKKPWLISTRISLHKWIQQRSCASLYCTMPLWRKPRSWQGRLRKSSSLPRSYSVLSPRCLAFIPARGQWPFVAIPSHEISDLSSSFIIRYFKQT